MSGKLQPVRGTRDLLWGECRKYEHIRNVASEIAERYGFLPIQTPIMEHQEVFSKTLGDATDIVGKEMYLFPDRGGDNLVLRPEFTAAIARLFICENLQLPAKLFTEGPVFRYERPQKCRQRQFHQINFEQIGVAGSAADTEMILLAWSILGALDLGGKVVLEINSLGDPASMAAYKEKLQDYLEKHHQSLSEESQRRLSTNPLRILDSKNDKDIPIVSAAPVVTDFYDVNAKQAFDDVKANLDKLEVQYVVNPRLVRGLDYYGGLVFEFKTTCLGTQDAVIAGGRYDGLISMMGGPFTPAVGFAGGVERLAALFDYSKEHRFCVAILPICEEATGLVLLVAHKLRMAGIKVACDYAIVKLKSGLKNANKLAADVALIFGEEELSRAAVSCKHMATGKQEEVSMENLVRYLLSVANDLGMTVNFDVF